MGWFFSIAALVVGAINHDSTLIMVSGLFAIAGSIGSVAGTIANVLDRDKQNTTNKKDI